MRLSIPRASWISAAVTAGLSLVLLAVLGLLTMPAAASIAIAACAGMVAGLAAIPKKKTRAQPRPSVAVTRSTTLISTLQGAGDATRSASDLKGVLIGIAADESGLIDPLASDGLVAVFTAHESAFEAARRMVSNVEALSRRTGRDLKIAIGLHSGPVSRDEIIEIIARLNELDEAKHASIIVNGPIEARKATVLEVATV